MTHNDDNSRCKNILCDIKMSCARFNDEDFKGHAKIFNGGTSFGTACNYFVLRRALGRENPDLVLTEGRRRGKRHNAHAYAGPRREFPGSEALFGAKLANAFTRRGKSSKADDESVRSLVTKPKPKLQRPDLLVTRHIKDGRDINSKED